ncbi:unnamed protein product [Clonostachys rosea]|uniref:Uncharacterized protein n=1 Tax=Bionectria ochroleuca TaxID=29856 RepID=A0ABY6TQD5_BIOOC|nr:unnamed protein product [Clonostachys rosea]
MSLIQRLSKAAPLAVTSTRPFSSTRVLRFPYKDTQDRESLRPDVTEHTTTARDSEIAEQHPETSFDPKTTSPEGQYKVAGKGSKEGNPLEASGANQPLSKPQGDEKASSKSGRGKETSKTGKPSRASGAPKNGNPRDSRR